MTPLDYLTSRRAAYPAVMTVEQIGALLNAVCWAYRHDGMRLLGKTGGHHVPQPRTGIAISSDYLVHEPTLTGHDALSGRDDGTTAVVGFEWGPGPEDLRGKIASGERTLVDPVDPEPGLPDAPLPPVLDLPPAGSVDRLAVVEQQVTLALAHTDALFAELAALHAQFAELRTRPIIAPHRHDVRMGFFTVVSGQPKT